MTKKVMARGGRKVSPRAKGERPKNPNVGVALRALWKTPEFREKMRLRDVARSAAMRERPQDFFRRGVPDGMRKPEADRLWAQAREKADTFMELLENDGVVTAVTIPDSDEDKAKQALKETCVLAFGPIGDMKIKLGALRTILDFTKQKPVQKTETKVSAEDFLNSALADMKNDSAEPGAGTAS